MNQEERIDVLLKYLLNEHEEYKDIEMPKNYDEKKLLLRGLMNVRSASVIDSEILEIQDAYLKEENQLKGIVDVNDLQPIQDHLYLWQGDITSLKVDAIVNAANSGMTGCYVPNHKCIDNCIHTYAGMELRNECSKIMKVQGYPEPTGTAKITKGYNLPCQYIIHTVGPIIQYKVSEKQKEELKSCYRECLKLADAYQLESIAFCCISTGEFHFPNDLAAKIAIQTVQEELKKCNYVKKVIFNVFKERDKHIYEQLLR